MVFISRIMIIISEEEIINDLLRLRNFFRSLLPRNKFKMLPMCLSGFWFFPLIGLACQNNRALLSLGINLVDRSSVIFIVKNKSLFFFEIKNFIFRNR